MRKTFAVFAAAFALAVFSSGRGLPAQQGVSLFDAVEQTAQAIARDIPAGTRVAVMTFDAENPGLSDLIIEELTSALIARRISVADRRHLGATLRELHLQLEYDTDEANFRSIGRFQGADFVIVGHLMDIGIAHRLSTNAINVESAIHQSAPRLNVRTDADLRNIIVAVAALPPSDTALDVMRMAVVGPEDSAAPVAPAAVAAPSAAVVTARAATNRPPPRAPAPPPRNAATYLDMGMMAIIGRDERAAINHLNEAIRLNPNLAAAHFHRGRANIILGNFDAGIADNAAAVRLDPDFAAAYSNIGMANLHMAHESRFGRNRARRRAIRFFDQAVMLDPYTATPFLNRGLAHHNIRNSQAWDFFSFQFGGWIRSRRALADYNTALELDPNNAQAYFLRGRLYYDGGAGFIRRAAFASRRNYRRAMADFETALQLNPYHAGAMAAIYRLGWSLHGMFNAERNARIMEEALEQQEARRVERLRRDMLTSEERREERRAARVEQRVVREQQNLERRRGGLQ